MNGISALSEKFLVTKKQEIFRKSLKSYFTPPGEFFYWKINADTVDFLIRHFHKK